MASHRRKQQQQQGGESAGSFGQDGGSMPGHFENGV
jgi:hypothetical protein